ncbi:23S rRNA (pseudouridine(1915)-N(3))-methyltransferase RlmH [Candidatus Woesearchaeota archaeon]|nr:23S rRNA (pseudouridine(1915)-N(3))-methyltransferase RlmH [Nanoarchaeota archaeon]MCB9370595.1 23S rRNA (pseudouridine(1915)-N(3))-methyltransferase RlmH [Candidatus Woesearchaeota archaeon]USN43676.1 MAG: 23S rRNA (pseudouridine(1915)-N(3))-methyltransferase RlmH [Candidatus Woesearchaeota archaeon]
MNIKIVCIGKLKNQALKQLCDELLKRLSRLEVIELKEVKGESIEKIKAKEYEQFKTFLEKDTHSILLSEHGKNYTTEQFHTTITKISSETLTFFVCGPYGPAENLKKEVKTILSLSAMTYTHEQALYMLLEQLYRHQCLCRGKEYGK